MYETFIQIHYCCLARRRDPRFFLYTLPHVTLLPFPHSVKPSLATTSRKRPPVLSYNFSKILKYPRSNHNSWNRQPFFGDRDHLDLFLFFNLPGTTTCNIRDKIPHIFPLSGVWTICLCNIITSTLLGSSGDMNVTIGGVLK